MAKLAKKNNPRSVELGKSRLKSRDFVLYRQILDPFTLLEHYSTQGAFDQVRTLTNGIQGDDTDIREPA